MESRRRDDRRGLRVTGTVTLGEILGIVTILIAIFRGFASLDSRMADMQAKVDVMWQVFRPTIAPSMGAAPVADQRR